MKKKTKIVIYIITALIIGIIIYSLAFNNIDIYKCKTTDNQEVYCTYIWNTSDGKTIYGKDVNGVILKIERYKKIRISNKQYNKIINLEVNDNER